MTIHKNGICSSTPHPDSLGVTVFAVLVGPGVNRFDGLFTAALNSRLPHWGLSFVQSATVAGATLRAGKANVAVLSAALGAEEIRQVVRVAKDLSPKPIVVVLDGCATRSCEAEMLQIGVDDYFADCQDIERVDLRVTARVAAQYSNNAIVTVDSENHIASYGARSLVIPPVQIRILNGIWGAAPAEASRADLAASCSSSSSVAARVVDHHVSLLRSNLSLLGLRNHLITVRYRGYVWHGPPIRFL